MCVLRVEKEVWTGTYLSRSWRQARCRARGGYCLARRGSPLLCRLLVCVERRAEVPLLLSDMLEGLVDVGLLTFCSQNGGVETGELLDGVLGADQVHNDA